MRDRPQEGHRRLRHRYLALKTPPAAGTNP